MFSVKVEEGSIPVLINFLFSVIINYPCTHHRGSWEMQVY